MDTGEYFSKDEIFDIIGLPDNIEIITCKLEFSIEEAHGRLFDRLDVDLEYWEGIVRTILKGVISGEWWFEKYRRVEFGD